MQSPISHDPQAKCLVPTWARETQPPEPRHNQDKNTNELPLCHLTLAIMGLMLLFVTGRLELDCVVYNLYVTFHSAFTSL